VKQNHEMGVKITKNIFEEVPVKALTATQQNWLAVTYLTALTDLPLIAYKRFMIESLLKRIKFCAVCIWAHSIGYNPK
jgi:hypothetical protein